MDINKRNRTELKSYFVKNAIPTESNFADLIEGALNQKDDGIVKLPGNPLSIEAAGDATSLQKALNLYRSFSDANPDWTINLNPRSNPNDASTGKVGFNISDGEGNSRLFLDRNTGNVGIGTTSPGAKLQVAGGAIMPAPGNADTAGIMFPRDPGGGSSDAAWVRYYAREGEKTTLEIGISNDADDHIALIASGNVGIGETNPTEKLQVKGGKIQLDGNQQIKFTDTDTTNNLKVQLWSGYGLGINGSTLFYAANGKHSWRDNNGANERMALTTGADGGLTVTGTGDSSFAGRVGIGTPAPGNKLTVSAASEHVQLRREATETTGGKQLFLELAQVDSSPAKVPEVYPSIRFHHHYRFWHRLEARTDGFHFKTGTITEDGYVDVRAANVRLTGDLSVPGGVETLRLLRGVINSNGTIFAGSGFTCSKAGTGLYDITFAQAFPSIPGASATQIFGVIHTGTAASMNNGGDTRDNAVITTLSANIMRVKTGGSGGGADDRAFSFVVIGPR